MKRFGRSCTLALAIAAALVPTPSAAIAPALLFMIKQIAQQAATSMFKDALLSGLSGSGCKGMALANAISAFDLRRGGAGAGLSSMLPGLSMSALPAGLPGLPGMPPGIAGMAGLGGMGQANGVPPEIAAKMHSLMPQPGQLPAGIATDPQQAAMLAQVQQAMSRPLSPAETLATIDELFELGFLPKAIQAEFKQCMVLVPASVAALGMGMAMLQPMVPQLRRARDELRALSPQEQDEVAHALVQEVRPLPADERAAFLEHIDSGFFPQRVASAVKRGLATP